MAPAVSPKNLLVITPGDPDGIGPEIVWKSLSRGIFASSGFDLLCVGARTPFEKLGARIAEFGRGPRPKGAHIWLLPAPASAPRAVGKGGLPGFQSGWSIETATRLVLEGKAQALVTGPISKERLRLGGYRFPGHTEMLAHLCGVKNVTMMLANDRLRVSLVTTHLALNSVSRSLSRARIRQTVLHTAEHLQRWWSIRKPRIAVAALNPHGGESGLFGHEEIRLISPEIRALQANSGRRFSLEGPFAADTLFATQASAKGPDRFDAVVCMYHDQGLIPVKLLDFGRTVNVTLGLPIIRTSVDHGVAFDLAGKGLADPSSFQSAVRLAMNLVKGRRKKS